MVSLMSLWLPILISAVLVFVVSAILHMVLPYHRSDFKPLPGEGEILDVMRRLGVPPGDYMAPHARDSKESKSPEFVAKVNKGPILILTVTRGGPVTMGKELLQWFLFCLFVSFFAAYVTSRALPAGVEYLEVFRFAGATAFASYALAQIQDSIWYKRSWSTTLKNQFDGLLYGLVTAGVFGWLWPGRP